MSAILLRPPWNDKKRAGVMSPQYKLLEISLPEIGIWSIKAVSEAGSGLGAVQPTGEHGWLFVLSGLVGGYSRPQSRAAPHGGPLGCLRGQTPDQSQGVGSPICQYSCRHGNSHACYHTFLQWWPGAAEACQKPEKHGMEAGYPGATNTPTAMHAKHPGNARAPPG